ncbi:MAG TPA: sigma-70 family RNA polymerase sigma factor [Actinomycetota bacterium]|nr:sigma-70 family RNA polymerase sigma factor [Actinomycetota bacterium]
MAETDHELVRRVGARDREAFHELYERYAAAAYGIALRVARQPFIAQEVLHDAFLAVWNAPEAFDASRGAFRTFLLSLVHHRAVDAVRREERLRERERRANPAPPPGEDVMDTVVEQVDLADRRREVRSAIADLPPEQREALELMYFRGWTQARIARETGVPIGTVKSRVWAAMRKLRDVLG